MVSKSQTHSVSYVGSDMRQDPGESVQTQRVKQFLAQYNQPWVSCFSSRKVQNKMMDLNGMSPAEFLRPFGDVGNMNGYQIKTVDKNIPYKLQNFRVNFIDAQNMYYDPKNGRKIEQQVLIENGPTVRASLEKTRKQTSDKVEIQYDLLNLIGKNRAATEQIQTPWFHDWKKQFFQSIRFQTHELTQQPIAFIYFISVEDEDPMGIINDLRRVEYLPYQYRNGVYDSSNTAVKSFVFILNDSPDERRYQDTCHRVKGQFNQDCVYEIKMTGAYIKDQSQLSHIDVWKSFVELDLRYYAQTSPRGVLFTKNDRTYAHQVVRKIIEKKIIPHAVNRIQAIEQSVGNTRKGFKNKIGRFFKNPERSENDGLRENFRMNKSDLELRNLIDLAFVIQDYETTLNNVEYPYNDFKKIKAFKHAAHCEELRFFAKLAFDPSYITQNYKEVLKDANNIYDMYSKATHRSQSLIRFSLLCVELFQTFNRTQDAADFMVRIAMVLNEKISLKPMFLEQAAYEYLMLQQFRKFSFYMTLAATDYEGIELTDYSFNCQATVNNFYSAIKGWNHIKLKLYTSLSDSCRRNPLNDQEGAELAIKFFKHLLELSHQFDDIYWQKICLNNCLVNFMKFSQDRLGYEQANIGQLNLPQVLAHNFEVFISPERVQCNLGKEPVPEQGGGAPDNLVDGKFLAFKRDFTPEDRSATTYEQSKSSGYNSQASPWRFLQKKLSMYMTKHGSETLPKACKDISLEELSECSIYDAPTLKEKQELIKKKIRKVYKGQAITVCMRMRNPMKEGISISKVKLVCKYKETNSAEGLECDQLDLTFKANEEKEIILRVIPHETGEVLIQNVEWELFDKFRCEYPLLQKPGVKLPYQIECIQKSFQVKVMPESSELEATIKLDRNGLIPYINRLIYTETDKGTLMITNTSQTRSAKNIYIACSHPVIFGFKIVPLDPENLDRVLAPQESFEVPITFRASISVSQKAAATIKFLVRYEVCPLGDEELPDFCRFRFNRILYYLCSSGLFSIRPVVHLSQKKSDEYLVNMQITQMMASQRYEKPIFESIELVQGRENWSVKKKDSNGNFMLINPKDASEDGQNILIYNGEDLLDLNSEDNNEAANNQSILNNPMLADFLQKEIEHLEAKKVDQGNLKREISFVVRWKMPTQKKQGFYPLLRVELLRQQKIITQQQSNISQQQRSTMGILNYKKAQLLPIHVNYRYEPQITHDFSKKPSLIVKLTLEVHNLLQTEECQFDCTIVAQQTWNTMASKGKSHDVSEGNSFLWVGKTTHLIKKLKPNQTKMVELKASVSHPGLYNLNRFQINMRQTNVDVSNPKAVDFLTPTFTKKDMMIVNIQQENVAPVSAEPGDLLSLK